MIEFGSWTHIKYLSIFASGVTLVGVVFGSWGLIYAGLLLYAFTVLLTANQVSDLITGEQRSVVHDAIEAMETRPQDFKTGDFGDALIDTGTGIQYNIKPYSTNGVSLPYRYDFNWIEKFAFRLSLKKLMRTKLMMLTDEAAKKKVNTNYG